MARLVADSTLELQAPSSGYYFEIIEGGLDAHPSVRGDDVTIPGKSGRTAMNRVADVRDIVLHGIVFGEASGGTSVSESFRSRMDALLAIFDPTEDPFSLTIHAPLHGLAAGSSASLNVRFLRFVTRQAGEHYRYMDIECECIDSPPDWVVAVGS